MCNKPGAIDNENLLEKRREYQREYQKKRKETDPETLKRINRKSKKKKKNFIASFKEKCINCGYSESKAALDFHHTKTSQKKFLLSKGHHYSYEKIKKEIQKCIVLCANCHRTKHHSHL